MCVVATNVAETSLTIPGIKYVVDSGKVCIFVKFIVDINSGCVIVDLLENLRLIILIQSESMDSLKVPTA